MNLTVSHIDLEESRTGYEMYWITDSSDKSFSAVYTPHDNNVNISPGRKRVPRRGTWPMPTWDLSMPFEQMIELSAIFCEIIYLIREISGVSHQPKE